MKSLKGEPVEITAGCMVQWNESNNCISLFDQKGGKLMWQTSSDKRIVSYIKTFGQFEDLAMIIAEMLNLNARKVDGERHPTFKFE